jgi:hypothetical protein
MQWHWGNIGSMLAGLAALLVAIVTLPQIPGGIRDWRERQRAQAVLAEEQREHLALERRARLYGWSGHGIDTFGVTLVTTPEELERAAIELGGYTDYVILRVSEQEHGANGNRAQSLRQIIEREGYISRPPTAGEREALEKGLDALGIPRAGHGQGSPPRLPDGQAQ